MHILFIGGTHCVGRAIAEAALERNHKITLLHRNPTTDPAFGDVEHVLLDRNGDLSSLSNRSFDATIDVCAYVPRARSAGGSSARWKRRPPRVHLHDVGIRRS